MPDYREDPDAIQVSPPTTETVMKLIAQRDEARADLNDMQGAVDERNAIAHTCQELRAECERLRAVNKVEVERLNMALCDSDVDLAIAVEAMKGAIAQTKAGHVLCSYCGGQEECEDCDVQWMLEEALAKIRKPKPHGFEPGPRPPREK